jgi:hypothetical protein
MRITEVYSREVMELTLQSVKVLRKASQETTCFEAELFVDGVRTAVCWNEGCGGMTQVRSVDYKPETTARLKAAEAYADALPPTVYSWGSVPSSLDGVVDELLFKRESLADLRRKMKSGTVYLDPNGNTYSVKGANPGSWALAHPPHKVLNLMPEEEALAIWTR